MWNSTNPALANDDAFHQYYGKAMLDQRANVATLQGVVNKTAILSIIAVASGMVGYWLLSTARITGGTLMIGNIVGLVVVFGVYIGIYRQPKNAVFLAPVYAVVEGAFLGMFTALADWLLAQKGIKLPGGVALQAFIITAACLGSMLALYSMGVLRATDTFKRVMYTAIVAIGITYLVSFIASFFVQVPFISMWSAANETGGMAWIGLGINLLILGIASLTLILDFDMIEKQLKGEAPKYMEWYCGFALLVTLAWIYYESVKMVIRIASMLNRR